MKKSEKSCLHYNITVYNSYCKVDKETENEVNKKAD